MNSYIEKLLFYPLPWRILFLQSLLRRFPILSYRRRLKYGATPRPHYGYCLYSAALEAKALGYRRISAVEFGVWNGAGLQVLENHAQEVEKEFGVEIEIYGFDTGQGMPTPIDYRDLPYTWTEGGMRMNLKDVEKSLKRSKLVIGNVSETIKTFFSDFNPAPIGIIIFDLDYYSSTKQALSIFQNEHDNFLPRIFCYIDDIGGNEITVHSDYIGVLLAINEFNSENEFKKLSPVRNFMPPLYIPTYWHTKIYVIHDFLHPLYNTHIKRLETRKYFLGFGSV